ncbi:hypothetical protein ACK3TF_002894 [Chlorella vulgaris]
MMRFQAAWEYKAQSRLCWQTDLSNLTQPAAQELYDQPQEPVNEVGVRMEPFHLRRELSEGCFDPSGTYLEYERDELRDAYLESVEDQVQGTDPGSGWRLPYQNEPVAEPPPLPPEMLQPYLRRLLHLLQPGETVTAGLRQVASKRRWALCCAVYIADCSRRLAGAGPVLDKFGNKEQARHFFQERVRTGHAVPPGNSAAFQELTDSADSVPSGNVYGGTAAGGAAAHGFAAVLAEDVAEEEVELGLGVVSAAPTAVELHEKQPHVQEQQLHVAAATPEGQAALEAALHGSFADGLP